jgi:hypothetical protein
MRQQLHALLLAEHGQVAVVVPHLALWVVGTACVGQDHTVWRAPEALGGWVGGWDGVGWDGVGWLWI